MTTENVSGLAYIDVQDSNPLTLFKKWKDEIIAAECTFSQIYAMCLATSNREGKVSNRNVVLKELTEEGFTFVTTDQGQKFKDITENPKVASTFTWNYKDNDLIISKQARIEGTIRPLTKEKCQHYYDQEVFYCKIRAHLCHQGLEVEWDDLKKQHDTLVEEAKTSNKILVMPDHYVGFEIVPEKMDFYYSWNHHIADRVVFTKVGNDWKFVHVAA